MSRTVLGGRFIELSSTNPPTVTFSLAKYKNLCCSRKIPCVQMDQLIDTKRVDTCRGHDWMQRADAADSFFQQPNKRQPTMSF